MKEGLQPSFVVEHAGGSSEPSTSSGPCFTCKPVLELVKPNSDIELRHSKRVLPDPVKPDKHHYRNLVAQNEWIRSNLFEITNSVSRVLTVFYKLVHNVLHISGP